MHWEPVTLTQGNPNEGLVTLSLEPPGTCREKMGQETKEGGGRRERESWVLVSGAFSFLAGLF